MKEEMSGGGSLKDKEAMQTLGKVTKETARKSTAAVSHAVEVKRIPTLTDESDSETKEMHVCKVCGSCFETRRGLSSHARSHLRQLGVSVSDSSGMPIDLLYKLIRDRDGKLPLPPTRLKFPQKTQHKTHSPKKDSGTKLKIKISNLVKKKYNKPSTSPKVLKEWTSSSQTSSPLLHPKSRLATPQVKKVPVSPILLTPSLLSGADSRFNTGSPSTSLAIAKPHWAPQETDAPLNLMMMDTSSRDDVHVCELCGAWYETRKGLSSHARAHLRQLGVENVNAKGAPIELLHEIIHNKDFQEGGGVPRPHSLTPTPCTPPSKLALVLSPERSGCKTPASSPPLSSSPPAKKAKPSPEGRYSDDVSLRSASGKKKHSHGGSGKSVRCEFCRETFKKSQSLASHARSHLRQLGITEWTVRGSPMATLREVMARRGPSATLDPPPPASSLPSLPPSVPSSPVSLPPVPPSPALSSDPSSLPPPPKVPKARKGSRTVSKPKDEPVEMDVCRVESPGARPYMPCGPTTQTWTPDPNISPSLIAAPKSEQEPLQLVSCDYCGDDFPSRKAFSCHARAHLRQLGVRWSANSSPIDTLTQLMHREGRQRAPHVKVEPGADLASQRKVPANSPRAFTPSPAPDDSALKERTASDSMGAQSACDATCELCGFDFENRKALASHARAHLRQLGVEWHVHGSPIETLNAWMQREPGKVAELHRRYMQGDLPRVRKRSTSSPYTSSDSEAARTALHRPPFAQRSSQGQQAARTVAGVASGSSSAAWGRVDHSLSSQKKRQSQGASQITYHFQPSPVAHSELNVRVPRGFERRPPKHLAHTESRTRESGPPKPQRLGNIPSLVPPPPPTTLVKLVGKVYSLKCRFCEEVFRGPLSVQEDWVMHLQEHIRNLKQDAHTAGPPPLSTGPAHATVSMATAPPLIGPQAV